MSEPCRIIGVLDNGIDGLTPQALAHLRGADLVIGARRTLALFQAHLAEGSECRPLEGCLAQVPEWITAARQAGRRVAVLATGDPLCHGIAAYLGDRLGREALEIIPNVSTIQLACARLGLSWQDMVIGSVHSRDAGEWTPGAGPEHGLYGLLRKLRLANLMGVFTSPENGPDRIARMLQAEGLVEVFEMAVAERLLLRDERIHGWVGIVEAAERRFADPNVVLLRRRDGAREALFGLPDARFRQRAPDKGLITKREVRAVSLARLALRPDSIVWDIGAGSGAVGLEAARLCPQGHVYAIEKNAEDFAIALSNRASLQVTNYTLVQAKAPQELDRWPDPDSIFIGGSGGELPELIRFCLQRLRTDGCLVMNFATLENLATAVDILKASGARWDVTQLQAARSRPILDMHRLQAENPVWIVCAKREHNA
ncbi:MULTISPECIES: precorrin-6y C5,15-methyltransferase (decarboxylating) subunit CbiE [Methylococcus]|uniref:Precorrin-6y C5,15-methyltransferase (Decarboxylating) subunit CbiE n=1 Tax=Methylococcus capsulatus TaxID=414 RepID=A0ABZ2F1X8_METCP|nr:MULTISPECIES: precorrin-6y C5,15-methyltransferase (decarboxylating) subunit CbiE [Methylococcus]MDF9391526.1 precorrin-6y C5,15-methyltransferase (decarboxylating) subunit CbiE [Methylococcus capsulatus]